MFDKLKSIVKIDEGKSKKSIENAVVFIIILILTIIIINTIWNDKNPKVSEEIKTEKSINVSKIEENTKTEDEATKSIKEILSKIEGVGKVDVLITYSETSQIIAMYNEKYKESQTEEGDTNGGTRTIQEVNRDKEIIYQE